MWRHCDYLVFDAGSCCVRCVVVVQRIVTIHGRKTYIASPILYHSLFVVLCSKLTVPVVLLVSSIHSPFNRALWEDSEESPAPAGLAKQ